MSKNNLRDNFYDAAVNIFLNVLVLAIIELALVEFGIVGFYIVFGTFDLVHIAEELVRYAGVIIVANIFIYAVCMLTAAIVIFAKYKWSEVLLTRHLQ